MVVSWPGRIKAGGALRSQFTHCIDNAPTVLEAAGIPEPMTVDGIEQESMDGTSFAHTFGDPNAEERHTVQYFEVIGSRAIYKDGWWACARPDRLPWDISPETLKRWGPGSGWDPDKDDWELYYLPDDFSQAKNVAAENPAKLEELKAVFWEEAERNHVLPLFGCVAVFMGDLPPIPTQTRQTYAGDVENVNRGLVPRIYGHSYAIEAEISVPVGGAEGVLVANADFIGGWGLWVDEKGHLNHTYSLLGVETYKQTSTKPIPTGEVTVKMLFETDENSPGAVAPSPSGRTTSRSVKEGSIRRFRSRRARTPAWTWAATTALSSTSPTKTRRPTPSPERSRGSPSTSSRRSPTRVTPPGC
ncbi:MAG TPA: hypothetical protein VEF89_28410 [Solirubrobacteraceae bacterium]|nr:hypothetical protein [Solirubrobacteraceae bacterium]